MEELLLLLKVLKKRGFDVRACENKEQAYEYIEHMIDNKGTVSSAGFGNSVTVRDLGLQEMLTKYTRDIYIHEPGGIKAEIDRKALTSDYYFTSANAVSLDGHIVNIDGTGNRTAATCFGPEIVIFIIGKNKITKTLEEAILRAKQTAVNIAKKYNRKTSCVKTGKCEDCQSPECVCAVTTIHRRKPIGTDILVILINEDLGI